MTLLTCALIGAPVDTGAGVRGCIMGPDAFRTAGLVDVLENLGHRVLDYGNVSPRTRQLGRHPNNRVRNLGPTRCWAEALQAAAHGATRDTDLPIFLGGDHSLSIGTVPGVACHARHCGRDQFVLWLDAHPDLHTLSSTNSGNLHGTPVGYFIGLNGFKGYYPDLFAPVPAENICMMGIRSVDEGERTVIMERGVNVHDMRAIDEAGIIRPLQVFLNRVEASGGALHVSLDVDFLDPSIAPAVGTTVPGGATFRQAHHIRIPVRQWSGDITGSGGIEPVP